MQKISTIRSRILFSLFITAIIFCPGNIYAQQGKNIAEKLASDQRIEKAVLNEDLGTPSLIRLAPLTKITLSETPAVLKEMVNADANVEFKKVVLPVNTGIKQTGIHTEKFQQFYKNIKVQHGVFNALMNGDKTEAYTGEYYNLSNLNITPSLTEAEALDRAKKYNGASQFAWDQAKQARDNETNPIRKQLFNDLYKKLLPIGELVIVKDYDTKNVSDIAYRFDIYSGVPLARAWVYVNAHTGKIMLYDKIIKHVNPDQNNNTLYYGLVPEVAAIMASPAQLRNTAMSPAAIGDTATVSFPTRYAGTRLIGTTNVSGVANDPSGNGAPILNSTNNQPFLPGQNPWVLNDKRFHGIGSSQSEQTYDLNGVGGLPLSVPAYGTAKSFTDLDNNWTVAEHVRGGNNEAENDDFGFDAHWGAGVVYQYWKNIHGRSSFDNLNSSIKSYIHSGIAYDNAFWNGSVMTYGDGSFQNGAQAGFAPLTSLDVCGHEIGHGVCSNTADLVYANESGAMNEGYSDIWAAMIEQYALINIDPTLVASATRPNGYSVWEIGEQIDARDVSGTAPNLINKPTIDPAHTALRYMDTPGKANDPSGYAERTNSFSGGAEQWTEIPCTGGPTLANDQCGVHNNSGVLNRMMYVLVAGASGFVNTRQALVNAAHGAQAAIDNTPYTVAGIGFAKAEKILYLTELNLTPNATFLQARNTAVLAAEVLYGKCSFEWKQTILAWNAVAVGKSSDTAVCSVLPLFSAAVSRNAVNEAVAKSPVNCTDAVANIDLSFNILTPGIANSVTITVTPSGTATNNQDYTLSSAVTTYAANETGLKKVTISVYNDAEVEGNIPETIILNIHAQDGISFTKDTVITVNIIDDDLVPAITNSRINLLSENFNLTSGTSLPAGWSMVDRLGASTVKWITNTNATGYGFSTKAAYVILKTPLNAGDPTAVPAYDPSTGGDVMLVTPLIDGTGKSDIKVKFRYAVAGEPAGSGTDVLDYGRILYSLDGINFQPFLGSADRKYGLTPNATLDSILLPASFNGKTFRLGFDWYNDANVAVNPPFIIDDVEVTGGGQSVETELNHGVAEKQFANKEIYYTSAQDGQVLARIANNNADLGCVNVSLTDAGNGVSATTFSYNGSLYSRAKKVIKITPSPANTTANYDIRLYATTAELTGITPASVKIIKVKDGFALSGNIPSGNAEVITPVLGDFNANGYYSFSAAGLTGFSQFVLSTGGGTPITYIFTGNGNWDVAANWSGNTVPPAVLNSGTIIIDNIVGGVCLLNVAQTISGTGTLTVNPGKNLLIPGSLIMN